MDQLMDVRLSILENFEKKMRKTCLQSGQLPELDIFELNKALHLASTIGNLRFVQLFLEYGAHENSQNENGESTLHLAASPYGSKDVIELLLQKGVCIDVRDNMCRTPLHEAVQNGHMEIVEILLKNGANKNAQNNDGDTPLHVAIKRELTNLALLLISADVDVNIVNNFQYTTLHLAAQYNANREIIELILRKGVDINVMDYRHRTPLYKASYVGHIEVVKILLEHKANSDSQDVNGNTPLHVAIRWRHDDITLLLINSGANINMFNNRKLTALHFAAAYNNILIIELLIKMGMNINIRDKDENTPLHISVSEGAEKADLLSVDDVPTTSEILLRYNANPNIQNKSGNTPLHSACLYNCVRLVEVILQHGGDPNVPNYSLKTPFHQAVDKCCRNTEDRVKYSEIVSLILNNGGDINILHSGMTPPEIAMKNEHAEANKTFKLRLIEMQCAGMFHHPNLLKCLEEQTTPRQPRNFQVIDVLGAFEIINPPNRRRGRRQLEFTFNRYREECMLEFNRIQNDTVGNSTLLYTILTGKISSIVRLIRNKNIIEIMENENYLKKYPIYGNIIRMNFRKALERKELMDQANDLWTVIFDGLPKLPLDCSEMIINFLENHDLRRLMGLKSGSRDY